jgi:hypothetical protein
MITLITLASIIIVVVECILLLCSECKSPKYHTSYSITPLAPCTSTSRVVVVALEVTEARGRTMMGWCTTCTHECLGTAFVNCTYKVECFEQRCVSVCRFRIVSALQHFNQCVFKMEMCECVIATTSRVGTYSVAALRRTIDVC